MSLKVMSGVLVVNKAARTGGNATISFIDNTVTGDAVLYHRALIGTNALFRQTPCHIVAVRQFTMHESAERPKGLSNAVDPITQREQDSIIIDHNVNTQRLHLTWRSTDSTGESPSDLEEISYLVIGET
jgi:hypothetical protein